jgi:hypothetical protein
VSQADPTRHHMPVSTTDALKAIALVLILVDHVGHYLADDWPILRVIGRLGVPIFFFLIGFARSRDIPWRWLLIGAVLTGVDFLWLKGINGLQLNILFNFAAIRLALPLIERHALSANWRLAALMLGLAAAMPVINPIIEYGTEGWLFAILGLLCRLKRDGNVAKGEKTPLAAALFGFAVFWLVETIDYAFSPVHSAILAMGLFWLAAELLRFERGILQQRPVPWLGVLLRFSGRYSLEIYAAQIILLAAAGGLWSTLDPDDGDDDE